MATVAVVDVETTGLNPYRSDRIVELAALVMRLDGTVQRDFVTIVNPERDIGPTSIHHLYARDAQAAPRFRDMAGALLEALDGCVAIAGHNVRFDHSFLSVEFERMGHSLPELPMLCTMQLGGGGSLLQACLDYGIQVEGETHEAWHDASAAAQLLSTLLRDAPRLVSQIELWPPIVWPNIPKSPVVLLTRRGAHMRNVEPPAYLQRLLARVVPDLPADDENLAIVAYSGLLVNMGQPTPVRSVAGYAVSR